MTSPPLSLPTRGNFSWSGLGQDRQPGLAGGRGAGPHLGYIVHDAVELDDETGPAILEAEGGVRLAGAGPQQAAGEATRPAHALVRLQVPAQYHPLGCRWGAEVTRRTSSITTVHTRTRSLVDQSHSRPKLVDNKLGFHAEAVFWWR